MRPANLSTRIIETLNSGGPESFQKLPQSEWTTIMGIGRNASHWYLSPTVMDLINNTDFETLISADDSDGYLEVEIRPPFLLMTVEYIQQETNYCVFIQGSDTMEIFTIRAFASTPLGPVYMGGIECRPNGTTYFDPTLKIRSPLGVFVDGTKPDQTILWMITRDIIKFFRILECDNVPVDTIIAPKQLNKKRSKKGKIQIPEYRTIRVSSHAYRPPENHVKGTHASPRCHWRRGHIRHMKVKGDMVKRWIKPTIVGGGTPTMPDVRIT